MSITIFFSSKSSEYYLLLLFSCFRWENTASSKMAAATKIQAGNFFYSLQKSYVVFLVIEYVFLTIIIPLKTTGWSIWITLYLQSDPYGSPCIYLGQGTFKKLWCFSFSFHQPQFFFSTWKFLFAPSINTFLSSKVVLKPCMFFLFLFITWASSIMVKNHSQWARNDLLKSKKNSILIRCKV